MLKEFSSYGRTAGINFSVHPLTLAFRDPSLERRFYFAYFENNLNIGRACHLIAVFFYITVGMWDVWVVDPVRLKAWLWVIAVISAMFFSGLAASYLIPAGVQDDLAAVIWILCSNDRAGFTLFSAVSAPDYPVYNFMGIIFCLFFCYAFIRLTFLWAVLGGNSIVAIYIAVTASTSHPAGWAMTTSFFYIIGINCLGMLVCYFQEITARRGFMFNELLLHEQSKITELNARLEQRVDERTDQLAQKFTIPGTGRTDGQNGIHRAQHGYRSVYWSKGMFKLIGKDPDQKALSLDEFLSIVHPDDQDKVSSCVDRALKTQNKLNIEFRLVDETHQVRDVHLVFDSFYDDTGCSIITQGTLQDITERKAASAALKKVEERLNQAQKMESVGRLAGGVAHDYNNMLSLIIGHAEMAMDDAEAGSALDEHLEGILAAAGRSADITRQLLGFARKQPISPRLLNLNPAIENTLKMLRRLIGENVELVWHPGDNLGMVKMDPFQIDQILTNLCVNARDAISGVGQIIIETGNKDLDEMFCRNHTGAVEGHYVMISISDDGEGMSKEVLARVFDPFYTTKEIGKGTGLGLSTVYGVLKQNRGFIDISSEVGIGTSVKVYLPVEIAASSISFEREPVHRGAGGRETILLVEDESSLLDMGQRMLSELGYKVVAVGSPQKALEKELVHDGPIDLLLTDVIMPGMNGRELAGQIQARRPEIRVLFMSGYPADIIAHHGALEAGGFFVSKPFSKNEIAESVRQALEKPLPDKMAQ